MAFIWRLIRRIFMLIGIGTVVYWGAEYAKSDSAMRKKVDDIKKSGIVQEGIKDMKTWAGSAFKDVGEELQKDNVQKDNITDEDRQKLQEILRKEGGTKDDRGTGDTKKVQR